MKPNRWWSRFQGLRFESLGARSKENLDDWLYELKWQPKELVAGNLPRRGRQAG